MKTFRLLDVLAVFSLALSQVSCGQDARSKGALAPPPPPTPVEVSDFAASRAAEHARQVAAKWNVRVDVLIVSVPESRVLELLPDLRSDDPQKMNAAVTNIQQMLSAKEATLIGWPEVVCLDGVRSVTETVDEKRYPTEFGFPAANEGDAAASDKPAEQPAPAEGPSDGPAPTAFETRNVGVTLEVEPEVLDDGRRLLLSVVPQHVRLLGFIPYGATDADGQAGSFDQPEFATTKTTVTLSIRNDQRVLLGMHKLDPEKDAVELFILHAVATKVE
jgi:hypothetical protein